MASKGKGGITVNTVWDIAQPIAESLGLELWDVRFEKEGADWFLRVFIDKDGGVSIDDCVDMTRSNRATALRFAPPDWREISKGTAILKSA